MKRALLRFSAFLFFLNSCQTEVSQEIYLIPRGFMGHVVVVYGHNEGEPDSIVANKIIYKIPQNGVLYVSGHQHLQDLSRMRYYYYDNNGSNEELCRYEMDNKADCKAMVYNNQAVSYQENPYSQVYGLAVITIGTKDFIPKQRFDPGNIKFKTP